MADKDRTLKIAICDDEKALCSKIEGMLENIAKQLNICVDIAVWFSGETLIDYFENGNGNYVDIIFLDIELLKMSGIDVANYIRDKSNNLKIQIVYISSKTNYALKLFKTHPYDFLVKPIREMELLRIMEGLIKILKVHNHVFSYKIGHEVFQVEYDDILYFKSDLHKVVIITQNREIFFYGKLKDIITQAPPQFLSIHKSYLINRDFVTKFSFDFVEMKNADILTISKAYKKVVRKILSQRRGN